MYSTQPFVAYSKEWNSNKLSLLIEAWWIKNMNLPLALNLHQQFAVGLQHRFVAYPKADPRRMAVQEDFTHRDTADEMNYARNCEDPSMPLSW